jgi:hypothetical protein
MTNQPTQPTASPQGGIGRILPRNARLWIGGLALAPVLALGVAYFGQIISPNTPEKAIIGAGFEPLIPPMRLREPGSLYAIGADRSYIKVCDPDPDHLKRVTRDSDTVAQKLERLMRGRFNVAGNLLDSLNAAFGGASVVTVTYTFTDVKVIEVAEDKLLELQHSMLSERFCDQRVQQYIHAKRKVCMGRQALRATTVYKVHTDSKLGADVQDKMGDIAKKIQSHVGSTAEVKRNDEIVGRDLLYGIKLTELCVAPRDATTPIPSPLPTDRPRVAARS